MFGLHCSSMIAEEKAAMPFGMHHVLTMVVCRGETLNLPHMMGLPNRCPRTDLEKLVFLCRWHRE
ncbi:protein of unknown function [Aminobacter niigataensis]|nr:protein of unknown function [Aminobacter niigataensis]CAI2933098.1 protein of unknown function [Aminobacter niigataensis]